MNKRISKIEEIEAIEKTKLPRALKQVMIALVKHKTALPTSVIAVLCKLNRPHASVLIARLCTQKIITEIETIYKAKHYIINSDYLEIILKSNSPVLTKDKDKDKDKDVVSVDDSFAANTRIRMKYQLLNKVDGLLKDIEDLKVEITELAK